MHTLRPCRSDDAAFIYDLAELTLRPHVEALAKRWSAAKMQAKCERDAMDPSYNIVVVLGKDQGVFGVEATPEALVLHAILLRPEVQSMGIGTGLLSRVLQRSAQCGAPVRLYVGKANPARQFYERFGFSVCGEDELHYAMQRPA